jgi:DNA-binding MarR family transcriptional regulator
MTERKSSGVVDAAQAMALVGDLRVVVSKLIRRLREQAQTTDLTSSQRSVLLHLEREGSATVTTLAKAEGMRPQSMGATVSALQAAGLISGAPHPNDGRQTVLSLTASCRKKLKASRAAKEDWLLHAIQNQLDAKEQEKLAVGVELLRRLADS